MKNQKSKLYFINKSFEKKRLKHLLLWYYRTNGAYQTIQLIETLKELGFEYATKSGLSISLEDLKLSLHKNQVIKEGEDDIYKIEVLEKLSCITKFEKLQQTINSWLTTNELIKTKIIKTFQITKDLNPLYLMSFSGARGNISQVRQLVGMRGLMSDTDGNILDFPIRSSFNEGLTLVEYLISCYGARKGIVDTALKTANSGYLTRRLVDVAQHVIVEQYDCSTKHCLWIGNLCKGPKILIRQKSRVLGRMLGKTISSTQIKRKLRRNKPITHLVYKNLISKYKVSKIPIRSPLTCESVNSICQLCYGWSFANQKLVSIGEAVGVIAAQSIGEPGTQLTMRTFHTGGAVSGEVVKQVYSPLKGETYLPRTLGGHIIRNTLGRIGFLVIKPSYIIIKNINHQKLLSLPIHSIIYIKHKQSINLYQLVAQLKYQPDWEDVDDKIYKEQDLCMEYDGQIFFENIHILEKRHRNILIRQYSQSMGTIWLAPLLRYPYLNNKISRRINNFDLVDKNFIIQHYFIATPAQYLDQTIHINPKNAYKRHFLSFYNSIQYDTFYYKRGYYFYTQCKLNKYILSISSGILHSKMRYYQIYKYLYQSIIPKSLHRTHTNRLIGQIQFKMSRRALYIKKSKTASKKKQQFYYTFWREITIKTSQIKCSVPFNRLKLTNYYQPLFFRILNPKVNRYLKLSKLRYKFLPSFKNIKTSLDQYIGIRLLQRNQLISLHQFKIWGIKTQLRVPSFPSNKIFKLTKKSKHLNLPNKFTRSYLSNILKSLTNTDWFIFCSLKHLSMFSISSEDYECLYKQQNKPKRGRRKKQNKYISKDVFMQPYDLEVQFLELELSSLYFSLIYYTKYRSILFFSENYQNRNCRYFIKKKSHSVLIQLNLSDYQFSKNVMTQSSKIIDSLYSRDLPTKVRCYTNLQTQTVLMKDKTKPVEDIFYHRKTQFYQLRCLKNYRRPYIIDSINIGVNHYNSFYYFFQQLHFISMNSFIIPPIKQLNSSSNPCSFTIIQLQKLPHIMQLEVIWKLAITESECLLKTRKIDQSLNFLNLDKFKVFDKPTLPIMVGYFINMNSFQDIFWLLPNQGQVYGKTLTHFYIRESESILLTNNGIIHVLNRSILRTDTCFFTGFYSYVKKGDIVQGIPKIEQFFEARLNPLKKLNLQTKLRQLYRKYKFQYNHYNAIRHSIFRIHQIIIREIEFIYLTQGIYIPEKHLEIVVRQMTSKVIILNGASTGLLRGEIVDLHWVEMINAQLKFIKIEYEPLILGITKSCLETNSFISSASFQETIRILTQSSLYNKMDFLCGLKENIIIGHLVPAGTGLL
uniref:DNA-directed RNA polymerase n=1 Tax=Pedobesia claviformis TaxID=2364088 RepID=A0A386B0Q1_9CHLO|nr:RNA polymerase b-subunit [Pedobesia claviformis]AYC65267.1 RNA polymerase b-subunit [Pedobesia claviformis]